MANALGDYSLSVYNLKHVSSSPYSLQNLFLRYHSLICRIFTPLPATGSSWEIVKRISVLVAPILYPLLAVNAAIGYGYEALSVRYVKWCVKKEVDKLSLFDKISNGPGKFIKINNGQGPFDLEILFTVHKHNSLDSLHADMIRIKSKSNQDVEFASLIPILEEEMQKRIRKVAVSLFNPPHITLNIFFKNSNQDLYSKGIHSSGHYGQIGCCVKIDKLKLFQKSFEVYLQGYGINQSYELFS